MCVILGGAFLLVFFLSPAAPAYNYVRTQTGDVIGMPPVSRSRNRGNPRVAVRLENKSVILVREPTIRNIKIGQTIEVDVLESENGKRFYRLSADPQADIPRGA